MRKTAQKAAMKRAWELRHMHGYVLGTAMKIAWAEMRGVKLYAMHMDYERRKAICMYVTDLVSHVTDIHDFHKHQIIRNALALPEDVDGVIVVDGKTCGILKYAAKRGAELLTA